MTADNIVPLGSLAKAFTAIGIMRLYQEGKLDLGDTIDKHVNEILMKSNGSTIQDIWNGDPTINKVTIYQLLHMKSGLYDYVDAEIMEYTAEYPDKDITPLDYLYITSKRWRCPPGTCESYSSIGYGILGLVLAQHAGANSW